MINNDNNFIYWWLVFVSFVASLIGMINKEKLKEYKSTKAKAGALVSGIATSMLVSYIVFEIAFYYLANERMSVALAGVGAWMGTDAFLTLQKVVFDYISRKK